MNATPKFITWLWDGSDCWSPQILDSEGLISLRERAEAATAGNVEVCAYPLHAFDAMREALKKTLMNAKSPEATDWSVVVKRIEAALKLAKGG